MHANKNGKDSRYEMPTPRTPPLSHSEGDAGDEFFVVEAGRFEARRASDSAAAPPAAAYDGGGCFGELALLHGAPRAATVTCVQNGALWIIGRPAFAATLHAAAAARRAAVDAALAACPLLAPLDAEARACVADAVVTMHMADGEVVVRQGDTVGAAGAAWFVVEAGAVLCEAAPPSGSSPPTTTRIGPGGWFGGLALLAGAPRAATVRAAGATTLLALTRAAFDRVAGPAADVLRARVGEYKGMEANVDGGAAAVEAAAVEALAAPLPPPPPSPLRRRPATAAPMRPPPPPPHSPAKSAAAAPVSHAARTSSGLEDLPPTPRGGGRKAAGRK